MRTKGWQKVFSFTFVQYIKTKSFIIGTVVICLITAAICVLTNILPVLLDNDDNGSEFVPGEEQTAYSTVYLYDEPNILTGEDAAALTDALNGTTLTAITEESVYDQTVKSLEETERSEAAVLITAVKDNNGNLTEYNVRTVYSSESGGADSINALISGLINRRVLLNAGVDPEKYADTQVGIRTFGIEAGAEEWSMVQSALNYFVPLVVSLVLFMLIFAYGQTVAQSIATEKTSKVMELLLTSVRPLAVVIGKVLAMGLVSFMTFSIIGIVGGISFAVSAPFGWMGKAFEIARDPAVIEELEQAASGVMSSEAEIAQAVGELTATFTPLNILLIIAIFLLGFLFYSLIAALVGASISRMEDLQAAMQPYALIGVLGMYLAYFPVIFNIESVETGTAATNPVQIFSYFFPISSPFALPSAILLGTLTPLQSVLATLLLAAAVVLIAVIVGKVYEAIILHNGNRIKLGDIIKMAVRK